jgi:hypothetical protein
MKGDHVELGETIAEALTDKVNAAGVGRGTSAWVSSLRCCVLVES